MMRILKKSLKFHFILHVYGNFMNEPKADWSEVYKQTPDDRLREQLIQAGRQEQMVKFSEVVYRKIQEHGRQHGCKPNVILMHPSNLQDLPYAPYYPSVAAEREFAFMGIVIRRCIDVKPGNAEVY